MTAVQPDPALIKRFEAAGQGHVFDRFAELAPTLQRGLLEQLERLDLAELTGLIGLIDRPEQDAAGELAPLEPLVPDPASRAELAGRGWEALRAGRVAVLVVAGGQGTRLGWDAPKGTYPVGPVSGQSLFQGFAEQVVALGRAAGRPLDLYVLTSRLNRGETEEFFLAHERFGLAPDQLHFLVQGDLPNVSLEGRLVFAAPGELAQSPNGHGGALFALRDGGALERMRAKGQDLLFYWQVDNPLCAVADPVFLGAHLAAAAEASTKVVEKTDPLEKVGLLALRGDSPTVVEYSEITPTQRDARTPTGALEYRAGNIAVHLFGREFLERVCAPGFDLGYHLARKAVPVLDGAGQLREPSAPNVVKFERFVFDVLPHARNHVALQVERAEEFEPLKNERGDYSPETVRAACSARARRWLEAAGATLPPDLLCEVSPLTALDPAQLATWLASHALPEPGPRGLLV